MNKQQFSIVVDAALGAVSKKGSYFYGWVNPPFAEEGKYSLSHTSGWGDDEKTVEVEAAQAVEIFTKKIDGAYGERFVMSLGLISSLIRNGYHVRFVQFQAEPGVPFDAKGWTVMIVDTMPMFHISPEDLDTEGLGEIIEILPDNQASDVCWKQTDKVGEFHALLRGSLEPGLNLVQIAQEKSES